MIGRVTLGDDVGVWFGAVIRGDREPITLGSGSNVQDLCVLHTDPGFPLAVGRCCTLGHRAILHGCTVGDGALIGMGAVVMNGAAIGAESIVGAGALVTEGKSFPPRSLIVGSPARMLRQLDDAAVAAVVRNGRGYVENWKRFAAALRRLD